MAQFLQHPIMLGQLHGTFWYSPSFLWSFEPKGERETEAEGKGESAHWCLAHHCERRKGQRRGCFGRKLNEGFQSPDSIETSCKVRVCGELDQILGTRVAASTEILREGNMRSQKQSIEVREIVQWGQRLPCMQPIQVLSLASHRVP